MATQAEIAQAILDTVSGCVDDCAKYDRVVWQLGDPSIECSTLAVGLSSFLPAAQVSDCALYELKFNIIVAHCCYPVGQADGSPPLPSEIINASRCVVEDVEKIMCCMQNVAIAFPGAVKQCKPSNISVAYSRPSGGCVVAKIGMTATGIPCCGG